MSDTDLRPTPGGGYKPEPVAAAPRKWWQTLKAWIGIVVLLAILGPAVGWYVNSSRNTALNVQPLLPESERLQRLQAMRSAVAAFYATPSDDTQRAAGKSITEYRRTFADALPLTYQAATEKIECGQSQECAMLRDRKNKEHIALAEQIVSAHLLLSMASMEYHTKVALDLAMERRITVTVPVAWIDEDGKHFKAERELDGLRERFFNDLDKVARGEGPSERDLLDNFKIYARASEGTFKPIKPGRYCLLSLSATQDGRLCSSSSSEVSSAYRRDRDAKVAAAKKAIKDRDAPIEILQSSISQIFR